MSEDREVDLVGSDEKEVPAIPTIGVNAEECFNYAAWQNAIPLLREVKFDNPTGESLSSLTIEMTASPAFVASRTWTVDRVNAQDHVCIKEIDV